MKSYSLFLVTVLFTVLIFILLSLLGVDNSIVSGAAGLPLIALPKVYEEMEKRSSQKDNDSSTQGIQRFDGFFIPWKMIVAYGAAAMFGISNGSVFLSVIIVQLSMTASEFPDLRIVGLIALPYMVAGLYFAGHWIGSRSSNYGPAAVICACFLSISASKLADYMISPEDIFMHYYGTEKEIGAFLRANIAGIVGSFLMFSVVSLVGYWRGSNRRVSKYMLYLLDVLPKHTRETLVNLAFEEVQMLSSQQRASAVAKPSPALTLAH
jgi:hypothetical protein